jgi:hypothetical protein
MDPVSIPEAARLLKLSAARVRLLASRGQLPAAKIADRWLVERSAVEQRRQQKVPRGRRFTPRNAWAMLMLASGENPAALDPTLRSRLRKALALEGLEELAPRLRDRADVFVYKAHSGEIPYVLEDEALLPSGISAAGLLNAGLSPGREADGYLSQSQLQRFVANHALSSAGIDSNVRLRVVPDDVWLGLDLRDRSAAPSAAVALDLADELDPRSQTAGRKLLREIDRDTRGKLQRHR